MTELGQRGLEPLKAPFMLVTVSLAWGLTWPAMKVALIEIPPFSMRASSALIGALTLYLLARLQGSDLRIPNRTAWTHVFVVALFNIICFSLFTAFAQLSAATSRVAMLVYTMPIWASLLAWIVLGERFTATRSLALFLCCTGMAILIYPLVTSGIPGGVLLALAAAMSWAAGTIYMKWAHIEVDAMAVAIWQLVIGFVVLGTCVPLFQGSLHLWDAHKEALTGLVFSGLFGSGIAYFLWYKIIGRVPAMTASLGVLCAPVIGVVASMLILGERPTVPDVIGFALIFAAATSVLLQPQASRRVAPRPT